MTAHTTGPTNRTWDHRITGPALPEATSQLLAETGAAPFHTAAGALVPYRTSKSTIVPLLCDLGDITVTDAVADATAYITGLNLYPGKNKKLAKTYAQITAWCAEHDITGLAQIVDEIAEQLLLDVARVSELRPADETSATASKKSKLGTAAALQQDAVKGGRERRRTHRVHNALVSLRAAVVLGRQRDRKHRVTRDSLAHGLPRLAPLVEHRGRPLTDEEVLLARLVLEIDRQEGGLPRPLIGYLLAESGVRPIESTSLDTDDLILDGNQPTHIRTPGLWNFGPRDAKLTRYAAATLPVMLTRLRTGVQPLTYDGADPGSKKAHASLSGTLDRHLARAGITDPYVTAKSISLWRVQRALNGDGGMIEARRHHGGRSANVLTDLKLEFDVVDLALGVVNLTCQITGEVVASVPGDGFFDDSITHKRRRKAA